MALSQYDRDLIQRCLTVPDSGWEDFVDRFAGLISSIVRRVSSTRQFSLSDADHDDLVAEVFVKLVGNDFAILRGFRGESSLATYLTVVARRIVAREISRQAKNLTLEQDLDAVVDQGTESPEDGFEDRLDQLRQLLTNLSDQERKVVELFHFQGKSYQQIHEELDIPMNSIGPTLSRARLKMRSA